MSFQECWLSTGSTYPGHRIQCPIGPDGGAKSVRGRVAPVVVGIRTTVRRVAYGRIRRSLLSRSTRNWRQHRKRLLGRLHIPPRFPHFDVLSPGTYSSPLILMM